MILLGHAFGIDWLDAIIRLVVLTLFMTVLVMFLTWLERKVAARLQQRLGPFTQVLIARRGAQRSSRGFDVAAEDCSECLHASDRARGLLVRRDDPGGRGVEIGAALQRADIARLQLYCVLDQRSRSCIAPRVHEQTARAFECGGAVRVER